MQLFGHRKADVFCSFKSMLISYFCCIGISEPSFIAKSEDRLFKHLFEDYQRWVRPVERLNDTIKIKFGLAISQLVDVVCIYFFPYLLQFLNAV